MFKTEVVRIVRNMIADLSASPTYDDQRLEELVIVAAQLVNQEINFPTTYTIDVDQLILTPDPTVPSNRDDSFINLLCLKSACILDMSEARTATSSAIAIRDGSSSIDLKGNALAKLKFMEKGWCASYQMVKEEYLTNSAQIAGACIMSPYRIFSFGGLGGITISSDGHLSDGFRY